MTVRVDPPPYLRGEVLTALYKRAEGGDRAARAAWRATVRHALADAGSIKGAAEALELGRRTIERWLAADASLGAGIAHDGRRAAEGDEP